MLGEPLCSDCYDYTGAVLFNAFAPELWRRFTIALRRTLARQAGLTNKALAAQVRVSFAKVAEYQRRGRCPLSCDHPPRRSHRAGHSSTSLGQHRFAHRRHRPGHPRRPPTNSGRLGVPARTLAWGRQADTRPITTTGTLTDARVAAYVAKYAAKAAECTGTLDHRLTPADQLDALPLRDHARRLSAGASRAAPRAVAHDRLRRPGPLT